MISPYYFNVKHLLPLILLLISMACSNPEKSLKSDREIDFNKDWNFYLSEENLAIADLKNPNWRTLNLPHDWVVENEFDSSLAYNAKATGYLDGEGYGYYQKKFDQVYDENKTTYLLFDGVYNNSEVAINGHNLGFHPYGYSPFYYKLSEHLNKSGKGNVIQVKIDHSRYADSRWYTGAGIYRNVKLIVSDKLHIPVWGSFIQADYEANKATIKVATEIQNDYNDKQEFSVETSILFDDTEVAKVSGALLTITAGQSQNINQVISIETPQLWSIDQPNLYHAKTSIIRNGEVIDTKITRFGIRNIKFDTNEGFFLNGENVKIKGVCLHHDGGLVGSAVPKGVWKRRLQILKDGGCNAIRVSHNPASSEFLDLCDEMGFLVQDELFDEWDNPKDKRFNQNERSVDYVTRGYGEHFQEWAEKDAKNTIKSHRNHPSIFQWSIGNEIEWTYPRTADATGFFNNMNWNGNYFWEEPPFSTEEIKHQLETLPKGKYDIGETANKIATWVRSLDTSRPITANMILPSASHLSGYADALDVIGYSYRRVLYDYGHENYPDKPIMGTENLGQYHEWKAVIERPFIAGVFLWTGIDYMGEIRDEWPARVSPSGLLNTAGFPRGSYYMFKALWTETPQLHIATQHLEKSLYKLNEKGQIIAKDPKKWEQALWSWQEVNEHWNYENGDMIAVALYSNCDEVELFLNNTSLGTKKLADFDDHIYKWAVPFADGELKAIGKKAGKEITSQIITAKKATKISINTDEKSMLPDGYDVAHIIVQLTDDLGNPAKTDDKEVTFEVKGNAKILGVDNGWKNNIQKFQSDKNITHKGRTMLIIQSEDSVGDVEVIASAAGMEAQSISIKIEE